ncbi:putative ribonuclease H1 [Mycena amicta]|nr:putative ribonuclease H1 [Mycena amicta]
MPYQMDVWADGACRSNGRSGAVGGAGVYFSKPVNGIPWSQARALTSCLPLLGAELTALILALELAIGRRNQLQNNPFFMLNIFTDSQYAIDCLTKWIGTWEQNGWRTSTGEPVKNRDLIEEASDLVNNIDTNHGRATFQWIPRSENANADSAANEACDDAEQSQQQYYAVY